MAKFDREKFNEAVSYICQKLAAEPEPSLIKLRAVLFRSDFQSYGETGKPITGATYRAFEQGPAPDGLDEALFARVVELEKAYEKLHEICNSPEEQKDIAEKALDEAFASDARAEKAECDAERYANRLRELGEPLPPCECCNKAPT